QPGGDQDRQLSRGQFNTGEGARVDLRDGAGCPPDPLARAVRHHCRAQGGHFVSMEPRHYSCCICIHIAMSTLDALQNSAKAAPPSALTATTTTGGAFHPTSRMKPTSATATSCGRFTALVQIGE